MTPLSRPRRWPALIALLIGVTSACPAEEVMSLRIGIAPDTAPLAFAEDGVVRGIEVDLALALARDLGVEPQLLRLPARRLVTALRGGRIDLIFTTLPTAELNALGLSVSPPLLRTGQMALVRREDLPSYSRHIDLLITDRRVGYERGSLGARFVQQRMPKADRVPLLDAATGITALREGEIDLFVGDAPTVWSIASNPDETGLAGLFRPLTDGRLAWAVRDEDNALIRDIRRTVDRWRRDGTLRRVIDRWLPIQIQVLDE
jgi:polar amino acid transport system substrate-binding protein